jgi:hypothetical protein
MRLMLMYAQILPQMEGEDTFNELEHLVVHIDETEPLSTFERYIERAIWSLRAAGQCIERLVDFFRSLRSLIGRHIQLLLDVLRRHIPLHELVLIEICFFEYHGLGRPPRMLSRALIAGLSRMTGRVCSSPALA